MYGLMLASVERLEAGPDFVQRLHGLLVTRQRRQLASPWPWLGLGIAILRNSRGDLAGVYRHEHSVPDRQLRPGVLGPGLPAIRAAAASADPREWLWLGLVFGWRCS